MSSSTRGRLALAAVVALLASGCGLPSGGARTVDDADVPYRLLEGRADAGPNAQSGQATLFGPLVFWVDGEGQLVPRPAPDSCEDDLAALLTALLASVADGPAEQDRSSGLSTAIPPDSGLDLVEVDGDLVVVNFRTEAQFSADRLPVAVGQLVLTMTSAPGIRRVSLLSDGEPVQIPLADGALTTSSVTPSNYASLVPPRYQRSTPFHEGGGVYEACVSP